MAGSPTYANPPIVELVLGAQFSPLTKLTAGHFGLFWAELGSEWTDPADEPILEDQFELFDRPKRRGSGGIQLRLEPLRLPARFLLHHVNQDRLLQIQPTRFHLNWRKREGFYPNYRNLITEFEDMIGRFAAFTEKSGLGKLAVNQWEITYIDAFAREEYWHTPADWATVLPGLFGTLFATDGLGLALENRVAEWTYEIEPRRGRLHIATHTSQLRDDNRDVLLLNMTARGPVGRGGVETLREGLDLGHDTALNMFLRVTSDQAKKRWEAKP